MLIGGADIRVNINSLTSSENPGAGGKRKRLFQHDILTTNGGVQNYYFTTCH